MPISVGSPPELSPNAAKSTSTKAVAKLSLALQGPPQQWDNRIFAPQRPGRPMMPFSDSRPWDHVASKTVQAAFTLLYLRVSGIFFCLPGLTGDRHGGREGKVFASCSVSIPTIYSMPGVSPAEPFWLSPTQISSRVRTQHVGYHDSSILFWVRLGAFEQTADFRSWQWMRPLVRNEAKFEFLFRPITD